MNQQNIAWPIAIVASLLIFAGLGVYFHEHGGFSLFGRKGLLGETLEQVKGGINTFKPTLEFKQISNSEIKNILAADEWIVAKIESEISVSEKRQRSFNTTLSFYTESIPVIYNYYVPVTDTRWNIRYSSSVKDGQRDVDIILLEVPDLKFEKGTFNCNISKLKICTDNFRWNYMESTRTKLHEALTRKLQREYLKMGISKTNLNLAKQKAEESISDFAKTKLKEYGIHISEDTIFLFKWIPEPILTETSNLAK